MNQLCRVCGEPAAGFHFGAFTCEGCKSFFGRSYNNLSSISECKNNGECVINKKNRTACKACRLRKCLLVGMSKSGSRYGRRSNWFKIHCLLQQQQQQASVGIATSTAGLLRPHPYYRHLNTSNPATTDAKSSESDSGASSADPEDEMRSSSAFSYFGSTISPTNERTTSNKILPHSHNVQKLFPGKVPSLPTFPPSISPSGLFPRWLPTFPNITYPATWRDLWLREPVPVAEPAPEQEQPIDLSLRPKTSTPTVQTDSESELNIDVGVEESIKHVPIDLSLDNSDKSGDIMN